MRTRCSPSSRPDARRWATVEVGSLGVRAWESSGDGSPSSNFRLAAAGRAAAAAETVASRNAHLACATLCAASESAMVECTDTALVYARRCAQVGAGKGPVPAAAASTQIARCLWAAGDDAGCAAELRSAVAVGAAPPGSTRRHRRRRWSRVHATSPPRTSRSSSRQVRRVLTCLRLRA